MPSFNTKIIRNQPIINVLVFKNMLSANNSKELNSHSVFKALVDTGAMSSTINSNIVERLGLNPVGNTTMTSVSHRIVVNTYEGIIGIPVSQIDRVSGIAQINTKFFSLEIAEMPNLGQSFDIIVGMDIIQQCVLVIHGDNLIFSF